jgi:hypothetical protein
MGAILGQSTFRNPTSYLKAALHRGVERCAIGSCLAA